MQCDQILTKFLHFGNILKNLGNFLRVYLVFCIFLNQLWQIFNAIGQFFIDVNGPILKNYIAIWLHRLDSRVIELRKRTENRNKTKLGQGWPKFYSWKTYVSFPSVKRCKSVLVVSSHADSRTHLLTYSLYFQTDSFLLIPPAFVHSLYHVHLRCCVCPFTRLCMSIYYLNSGVFDDKQELIEVGVPANITTHTHKQHNNVLHCWPLQSRLRHIRRDIPGGLCDDKMSSFFLSFFDATSKWNFCWKGLKRHQKKHSRNRNFIPFNFLSSLLFFCYLKNLPSRHLFGLFQKNITTNQCENSIR